MLAISLIKTLGLNIMLILNFMGSVSDRIIGAVRYSSRLTESAVEEPQLGSSRFGVDAAPKRWPSSVNNSLTYSLAIPALATGTASRGTFAKGSAWWKSGLTTEFLWGSSW